MPNDIWGYPTSAGYQPGMDLTGFHVEASDGAIGKVDRHTDDVGQGYLLVDTGVWIFGKKVLLPAGTIRRIDIDRSTVFVARAKEEIKNAPEYHLDKHTEGATDRPNAYDNGVYGMFGEYYRMVP